MIGPELFTLEPVSRSHMTFPNLKESMSRPLTMLMPTYIMILQLEKLSLQPRQSTVETATYGSEFVAARTAVDQIIDIRTTLRYLGVPIRDKSYMFGDNKSVVTSSTIPNSTISKRHHLASYHRVREKLQPNSSHSIGKMARATQLTSSANIGSLQLCGPCSSLSCSGGARLPPS